MPTRKISKERESALVTLLDDDSQVVRAAVVGELKNLGSVGVDLLKKISNSDNRILADHAKDVLLQVAGPDPVNDFIKFIRSLSYELETGYFLLSRTIAPQIDFVETSQTLDEMAKRVRELLVPGSSPTEQCRTLSRVMFHEYGFRGDKVDFDNPENSLFHTVLKRRKGIPISLSIVYILVANRCGIEVEPVGLPGRFMVGLFHDSTPLYIDPYERGAMRTVEEIAEILQAHDVVPEGRHFTPSPVGEILARCCRNLTVQYAKKNNLAKSRLFQRFDKEFALTYKRQAESR